MKALIPFDKRRGKAISLEELRKDFEKILERKESWTTAGRVTDFPHQVGASETNEENRL